MPSSRSRIPSEPAQSPEAVHDLRERLAEVLHDLHTPLAALSLLAIPEDATAPEDEARRQLRRAVTSLRRHTLILRDHPLFRSSPMVLSRSCVDLSAWLREVRAGLEELAHSRGIDIEWDVEGAKGGYSFDAQRMGCAIEHLFMHRARRSARPGHVRVRCESAGGAGFEIGIAGIEAPDPDPLTPHDRFSAGVEFAEAVIASHGGTLEDRELAAGWREWLVRMPSLPGSDVMFAKGAPEGAGSLCRVLVVEDDEALRGLLVDLLSIRFQVDSSADASAAIVAARANPPDLVVADQGLPDSLGTDLAKAIRAETGRDIPLLLVTGYSEEEALPRIDRMRILLKPFRGAELLARSTEMLREFTS